MYEKILVPLDGSQTAEVALPYAEELAGRLGSEIVLLHIAEPGTDQSHHMYESYLKEMAEVTKRGAEKYMAKPSEKTIKVGATIIGGDPGEEIVRYADKENIGLILMATRGRSGITRWAVGSVAEKVSRAAKQPIALIRAKSGRPDLREKDRIDRILLPLDGSKESEAVLPYVEELSSKLQAEVVLLRIFELDFYVFGLEKLEQVESSRAEARDYLAKIEAQFKQKGINARSEFRELTPRPVAEEILKLADEIQADVVAMSTHGRSGVSQWAFGSVADKVLHAGNTPLLLVRVPETA